MRNPEKGGLVHETSVCMYVCVFTCNMISFSVYMYSFGVLQLSEVEQNLQLTSTKTLELFAKCTDTLSSHQREPPGPATVKVRVNSVYWEYI